jgi:type IV pilus assembly protein PilY1
MKNPKSFWLAFALVIIAACNTAWCGTYQPCKLPPQISSAFLPNVLLVMDFSGSMQVPAFYDPDPNNNWDYSNGRVYEMNINSDGSYRTPVTPAYVAATTYFGLFQSDHYYQYNYTLGYFYDIGTMPASGAADNKGDFSRGIYGNILNFYLTSRTDAALKALIGGKSAGPDTTGCTGGMSNCGFGNCTDSECYIMNQGARRQVVAQVSTATGATSATLDIRPSTWSATDLNCQTYDSASNMYPTLTQILTSLGTYTGKFESTDSSASITYSGKSSTQYYELWQLKLDVQTKVNFGFSATLANNTALFVRVLSSTSITSTVASGEFIFDSAGDTGSITLNAGTYYVGVITGDKNGSPTNLRTSDYKLTADVPLTPNVTSTTQFVSSIGGIKNARVRLLCSKADRVGVIQNTWSQARYGFMYFNSDYKGKLAVACNGAPDADTFAKYLEGKMNSNGQPYPYNGTPSGEAMNESLAYFQQSTSSLNGTLFGKTTAKDPYYEVVSGTPQPLPCRKSYVILISDGLWNGDVDPMGPAYTMHRPDGDIRGETALPGAQNVDVFTVSLFDTSGSSALKWVAMFGGFSDLLPSSTCKLNLPYPMAGTSLGSGKDSSNVTFPTTGTGSITSACIKATPDACCKEWNAVYDLKTPGDNLHKGVPDNYYEVTNGDDLATAISQIIGKVNQTTASSSAVATLSQKVGEGDEIIRGLYEALTTLCDPLLGDKTDPNYCKMVWWGHLEVYWPNSDGQYDFEIYGPSSSYKLTMCKQIQGVAGTGANCWDASMQGDVFSATGPWLANTARKIKTILPNVAGAQTKSVNLNPKLWTVPGPDYAINFATTTPYTGVGALTPAMLGIVPSGNTATDNTNRDNLIKWVRGDATNEYNPTTNPTGPFRPRLDKPGKQWVLGDIVYSTPVIVGPPTLGAISQFTKAIFSGNEINVASKNADSSRPDDPNFRRYFLNWRQITRSSRDTSKAELKNRDKVVYVGGNDGMLHAFLLAKWDYVNKKYITARSAANPDIGNEIWAYIPSNFLDQLTNLADPSYGTNVTGACKHRFMVDLAPRPYEVFWVGSGIQSDSSDPATTDISTTDLAKWPWRTVLLGGERGGGDVYFAIDVTDPYNPLVLWEYSVYRDKVAYFDFEAALPAFVTACADNAFKQTPPAIGACQAPTFPTSGASSWFLNHCASCSCVSGDCSKTTTDFSACRAKLATLNLGSTVWKPFNSDPDWYNTMKVLPMTWSRPYVGRVGLAQGTSINSCDPVGAGCAPGCSGTVGDPISLTGIRNLAIIGGGIRQSDAGFDASFNYLYQTSTSTSGWPDFYQDGFRQAFTDPFLLALDIETGENAFRYLWPALRQNTRAFFPDQFRQCNSSGANCQVKTPYAMSDPMVLDIWDRGNSRIGDDGYADYIYVADLNGVFYGIKLNMSPTTPSDGNTGVYVDVWKTKPIPVNTSTTLDYASNDYRSDLQPITVQPSAALENAVQGQTQALRIVLGGGKHEDTQGAHSDATDAAKMSLYNLRDAIMLPVAGDWTGSNVVSGTDPQGGVKYWVRNNCSTQITAPATPGGPWTNNKYRCIGASSGEGGCNYTALVTPVDGSTPYSENEHGCRWAVTGSGGKTVGDCCESDCTAPCWSCIMDLQTSGEKLINKPLIAGGVAFFTTFAPMTTDPCSAGGTSYLYALEFMCGDFPAGFNPIADLSLTVTTFAANTGSIYGAKANLGLGVASQPVLDSSGKYVVVQLSNAALKRIEVNLVTPPAQLKGWREN